MKKIDARTGQAGFTLMEILIVVAIIALVAGYAASRIFDGGDKAKASLTKAKMGEIAGALDMYKLDVGRYPTTQDGLNALLQAPGGASKWNGPYVKNTDNIKDAWGADFVFKSPGEQNRPFEMVSLGGDGKEGGDSPATRDIKSWD